MKHTNKTTKRAFTLIELLIVIAIIGILFVVLVSRVDFATDKAKATGVQTDFRSFQVALETVSKENAGFASFGWNTGDDNGDRIRNSYDEGDIGTGVGTPGYHNGKVDSGEIWTGRKVYGETWGVVYTLVNPADNTDTSAFEALEAAVNANLDPKLHITITPELSGTALTGNAVVSMANGAQDPWKKEYHGVYITNAVADNGADRGAFVIYSDGANGKNGSEHDIANGIVTINVPGDNKLGKDDYSIAVVYTFANGYGEVKTSTSGFSNNQDDGLSNMNSSSDNTNNTPPSDDTTDEPTQEPSGSTIELNEHGFVYGVPYVCDNQILLFYEDGSVQSYIDGRLDFIDGIATYNDKTMTVEYDSTIYFNFTIADDGLTLLHKDDEYSPEVPFVYDPQNDLQKIPEDAHYMTIRNGYYYERLYWFLDEIYEYDVFVQGDYIYQYTHEFDCDDIDGAWRVFLATYDNLYSYEVYDRNECTKEQASYGDIPSTVLEKPVVCIAGLFEYCTNLIQAPKIPDTIIEMSWTFNGCSSLKTFDTIPANVILLNTTFAGCTSLEGNITILVESVDDILDYYGCFDGVDMSKVVLSGTGTNDEVIAILTSTANTN